MSVHRNRSRILIAVFSLLSIDRVIDGLASVLCRVRLGRLHRAGVPLHFVAQGGYRFEIAGPLEKFHIDETSHIKSDTFIECSGGVSIGRYFHVGRGLTIFSSAHEYKESTRIPYDERVAERPVRIGDFVWCGANVMILPGVTIGKGAIVGAGSVVTKNIPDFDIVAGNPARKIGQRDRQAFEQLEIAGHFY